MGDRDIIKRGLLHASGAFLYIVAVATMMYNANHVFGTKDNFLTPILVLSLFVLSAAVMGMLIFGKPVMLYMDGKKRDSVKLVTSTIGSLAVITVLVIAVMATISR